MVTNALGNQVSAPAGARGGVPQADPAPPSRLPHVVGAVCSVTALLFLVVTVLDGLSTSEDGWLGSIGSQLNTSGELNLAAFYAAVLLLSGGLLALALGRPRRWPDRRARRAAQFIGLLLLLAALDEVAQLHERSVGVLVDMFEGVLSAGVSRALAVLLVVAVLTGTGLIVVPGLAALPSRTRTGLVAGAALFLLGALGLETLSRALEVTGSLSSTTDVLLAAAEELFEMLGAIVVMCRLLELVMRDSSRPARPVGPSAPTARLRQGRPKQ